MTAGLSCPVHGPVGDAPGAPGRCPVVDPDGSVCGQPLRERADEHAAGSSVDDAKGTVRDALGQDSGRAQSAQAAAIARVLHAIDDPGSHPEHHARVLATHRAQWPALWAALDDLQSSTDELTHASRRDQPFSQALDAHDQWTSVRGESGEDAATTEHGRGDEGREEAGREERG